MKIMLLLNFLFYKILRLVWPEKFQKNKNSWYPNTNDYTEKLLNPELTQQQFVNASWPPRHWIDLVKSGFDVPLEDLSWFDILTNPNLFTYFTLQYWCFIPEFLIFSFIIVVILIRKWDFKFLLKFTLVFFHLIFLFSLFAYLKLPPFVRFFFEDLCFTDNYIFIIKIIIFLIFQFFLLVIYHRYFDKNVNKVTEEEASHYKIIFILFLSFLLLSLLFVSTNDFFCFYIILEGLSFGLIFSCVLNFNKTYHVITSARYFVYNLFVSGGLLLGIIFLYGFLGTTNFFYCKILLDAATVALDVPASGTTSTVCISVIQSKSLLAFIILFFFGSFFKLGCFPFNLWMITVNQRMSYEVSFVYNIIFKNLFFFVFFRICTYYLSSLAIYWSPLLLFFGYCSVFIGTLGAFGQKRIKSFLTFSSIAQMGHNLIGMSCTTFSSFASVFFLQFTYMFGSIIVVGCLLYLSCDYRTLKESRWKTRNVFYVLSDLQLLRQVSPLFSIAVTIAILSMAGLPPTLGFFAKYYYYEVLFECGMTKLCIVLILLNGLSLYYYVGILKNIWLTADYDAANIIYIPRFYGEVFMVFTTFIFSLLNIFAIFIHKHILFLVSKLSLIGSSVVFSQVYVFLMKYSLTRYLYLKSIQLSNDPHVQEHLAAFIEKYQSRLDISASLEFAPKSVIANSYFERDMIRDNIIHRDVFTSWRSSFENFFGNSEWTAFSTDSFVLYQFALLVLIVITCWSFHIIYALRLDRLFLAHPAIKSFKWTTENVKELLLGTYGFPIWFTALCTIIEILLYMEII